MWHKSIYFQFLCSSIGFYTLLEKDTNKYDPEQDSILFPIIVTERDRLEVL